MPAADVKTKHVAVDVAVVGAGAAGLYAALVAAEAGASVRLISSAPLSGSASFWAQGGLAAAIGADDHPELHLEDTIVAGRSATRAGAARVLCDEAPERVRELVGRGVRFDTDGAGALLLGLEGGHSRRRIVHAGGSATGRSVASALSAAALADTRIEVHERSSATALWIEDGRCGGVVTGEAAFPAGSTLLATGGAAALWQRTTNPPGAIGSGLLLALGAGAELADLELLQFHPTALLSDGPRDGFLITEAVRGEGARLLGASGERFVDELAPRDEVARAVHAELERSGAEAVLLDMSAVDLDRFPNVVAALADAGIDPREDPVPVAPAAHYMIGGIVTDAHGRCSVDGLYAVGECACTGMHGANRLASNSLSECFVFGRRAALAAARAGGAAAEGEPPSVGNPPKLDPRARAALWVDGGIVRDDPGLRRLAHEAHPLVRAIAHAALARTESRGCHLRSDLPERDPAFDHGHLVTVGECDPRLERWS